MSPGTRNMSPGTGATCHPVLEEHVTRYWRNMSPGTGGTRHPVLEEHITRVFTKVMKAFTLPAPARSDLTAPVSYWKGWSWNEGGREGRREGRREVGVAFK